MLLKKVSSRTDDIIDKKSALASLKLSLGFETCATPNDNEKLKRY